jgi:hypothetical protein
MEGRLMLVADAAPDKPGETSSLARGQDGEQELANGENPLYFLNPDCPLRLLSRTLYNTFIPRIPMWVLRAAWSFRGRHAVLA